MARDCIGHNGNWIRFPRPGGWHEQDPDELDAAKNAWAIERMIDDEAFRQANGRFRWWFGSDEPGVPFVSLLWMIENS